MTQLPTMRDPLAEPDPNAIERGALVLRIFRAAAIKPPYGVDVDDADAIWGARLLEFTLEDIVLTARRLIDRMREFPTIADFIYEATQVRRERRESGRRSCALHAPSFPFLLHVVVGEEGTITERNEPCPSCCPRKNALWLAGHFDPSHSLIGCTECRIYLKPWSQVDRDERQAHDPTDRRVTDVWPEDAGDPGPTPPP